MVISRTLAKKIIMKRFTAIVAVSLLTFILGCKQETVPKTATKPKELADPELALQGVPGSALESGESFTITVTTKSSGDITVSTDKPTVATVAPTGTLQYKVTAVSLTDVKVKLIVSQQEQAKTYAASKIESVFSVKGSGGDEELPGPEDAVSGTGVTYVETDGPVAGPERGMYKGYEVRSDTEPISASVVKSRIASEGTTLWLLEFYLTDFMTGDISSAYLNKIKACFDGVLGGGAKAVVRFAYRWDGDRVTIDDQEPKLEILLKHIQQIKPILTQYESVIMVLQAGFIGCWGEWYYTTNVSSGRDRRAVVDALLDALPVSRQIELRTPAFKMGMFDLELKDTLTSATAHDGSAISRLAGHNDCFGADKSDRGTFDNETSRKFWKADTRYTIMGGETCEVSDYCLCPQTLQDLKDYHWTYLHDGYRQEVLSRWQTDGCMEEIKSRLGYRLVLKDVHYDTIKAGQKCKITIRLYNNGFAAPMNPREAWLVWVGSDGKVEKSMLGADPRTWHSGYNAVVSHFTPTTDKGTLYLELSDPLLKDRPEYSIPLANKDVFDPSTGYNKLIDVK